MKEYALAVFRSRQHTMLLYEKLKSAGLKVSLVHTPSEIAIGCGLSMRFETGDYEKVRRQQRMLPGLSFVGYFRVRSEGTRLRCEPFSR